MSPLVPGATYHRTYPSTDWVSPGRLTLPGGVTTSPATSRAAPVRGVDLSNSNVFAGILPGWTPDMYNPIFPGSSGMLTVTDPSQLPDNSIVWGGIAWKCPDTEWVPKNVIVTGGKPSLKLTDGVMKNYGTGFLQSSLQDSLIDPELWLDPDLEGFATWSVPAGYRYPGDKTEFFREFNRAPGLHGGNMTLTRVEIRNCVDSVNSNQSLGGFTLLEDVWLHSNHYYRDPVIVTQAGGWHSDGFQFSLGTNMTILGGFIGGPRADYGLDSQALGNGIDELHYNPGSDPHNAGIMLKQEPTSNPDRLLANITVDGTVFQGGDTCINHFYSTTTPNPMSTVAMRNLKFVKIPTVGANGQGAYITRNVAYASCYDTASMRLITLDGGGAWTDVGAAPITNG